MCAKISLLARFALGLFSWDGKLETRSRNGVQSAKNPKIISPLATIVRRKKKKKKEKASKARR